MRYYCHNCQEEVDGRDSFDDPERDPECSICGSTFVEKVGQNVENFLRRPPSPQPPQSQSQPQAHTQSNEIPPQPPSQRAVSSFQTTPHVVTMLQIGGGRGTVPMNVIRGGQGGRGAAPDILSMLLQGTGLLGNVLPSGGTGSGLDEILHQLFLNDPGVIPTPTTPETLAALRRERNGEKLTELGECGITLEPFEPGDVALIMPCDHAFKEEAITQWLTTHNTCPGILKASPSFKLISSKSYFFCSV